MLLYRCKRHKISLSTSTCSQCGSREHVERRSDVYWCPKCGVPLYEELCGVCGCAGRRVATDLRPVFPEERLLIELLWGEPLRYRFSSVWGVSAGGCYVIDGQRRELPLGRLLPKDEQGLERLREGLARYAQDNQDNAFSRYAERFVRCNRERFHELDEEAQRYIREVADGFDEKSMFVSFSGGKDSTVTSDLVTRALGTSKVLHLFGDTTLEFPWTQEYVARFKQQHPSTPVLSSRNREKDFMELCRLIGPPSRMMRWCCTVFKTGAIARRLEGLFRDTGNVLAFYGIRRRESAIRNRYERASEGRKIAKQLTVSPVIDWMDFDIWLYLLTMGLEFNAAYRYGYTRVGCWCCPNNGVWSEFLSRLYLPEQWGPWRKFLVGFAEGLGKPDAEEYIDSGKWKARQGGNGVAYASRAVLSFEPCATEEDTVHYELQRPVEPGLYELFKPFGTLNAAIGNARLGEVYVLDPQRGPLLRLRGREGTTHLRVTVLQAKVGGAKSVAAAKEKIRCQLMKYQMCIGCRACEGVCRHGAIRLETTREGKNVYRIDDAKCVRCAECVSHFYTGCYLRGVLATKY